MKVMKRAMSSAVLSAGAWAEKFGGGAVYPPHFGAGRLALLRAGRPDLVESLRRRIERSVKWDVVSLDMARQLVKDM